MWAFSLCMPCGCSGCQVRPLVLDPCGDPVPGASLTLSSAGDGTVVASAGSDGGGGATFDVPPGHYRLRVEAGGFAPQDVDVFACLGGNCFPCVLPATGLTADVTDPTVEAYRAAWDGVVVRTTFSGSPCDKTAIHSVPSAPGSYTQAFGYDAASTTWTTPWLLALDSREQDGFVGGCIPGYEGVTNITYYFRRLRVACTATDNATNTPTALEVQVLVLADSIKPYRLPDGSGPSPAAGPAASLQAWVDNLGGEQSRNPPLGKTFPLVVGGCSPLSMAATADDTGMGLSGPFSVRVYTQT